MAWSLNSAFMKRGLAARFPAVLQRHAADDSYKPARYKTAQTNRAIRVILAATRDRCNAKSLPTMQMLHHQNISNWFSRQEQITCDLKLKVVWSKEVHVNVTLLAVLVTHPVWGANFCNTIGTAASIAWIQWPTSMIEVDMKLYSVMLYGNHLLL